VKRVKEFIKKGQKYLCDYEKKLSLKVLKEVDGKNG
jgi:hypothetical protein